MQDILLGLNLLLTSGVFIAALKLAYGYGKLEQRVDAHDKEFERFDREVDQLWTVTNKIREARAAKGSGS